jgi:predicted nucleic acid-binding protein
VIVLDTNLLVYAHRRRTREHAAALEALHRASKNPEGWGMALPSVAEFWAIVTHPSAEGGPSTFSQSRDFLAGLADSGLVVLPPPDRFAERLAALGARLRISGTRVFDLQIAMIALSWGATKIWTHDPAFVRLPGLEIIDPIPATLP